MIFCPCKKGIICLFALERNKRSTLAPLHFFVLLRFPAEWGPGGKEMVDLNLGCTWNAAFFSSIQDFSEDGQE